MTAREQTNTGDRGDQAIETLRSLDHPARLRVLAAAAPWPEVVRLARMHRCDGLLVSQLHRCDALPAHGDLESTARRAVRRAHRYRQRVQPQLLEVAGCLAERGIPVTLLKGASLLTSGLRQPTERPIGDLDLLVPEDAWIEAAAALQAQGYEYRRPQDFDYARRWHYQLPALYHRDRPLGVELHRHILSLKHRLRFDELSLQHHPLELADGTLTSRLDDADELTHLSLHFWADRAAGLPHALGQLYDIRRRRASMSAASVDLALSRAHHRGIQGVLGCCLQLERLLLESAPPGPGTEDQSELQRFAWTRVVTPRPPPLQFVMVSEDVGYTPLRVAGRVFHRFRQYRRSTAENNDILPPGQLLWELLRAGLQEPRALWKEIHLDRWAQSLR